LLDAQAVVLHEDAVPFVARDAAIWSSDAEACVDLLYSEVVVDLPSHPNYVVF